MPSPTTSDPTPVRTIERVGYAAGDLASCLYYNTFSVFLLIFYTDTFGIGPAAAGTMLLITRTWDNFADPVMGMLADRTRSRHGKFRPWLAWVAFPFMIAGILTFTTPNLSPAGKLLYAYITYSVVMLVYTAINVPYSALLGVLTPDSDERTRLSSYRFLGAFGGNLVVQGSLLWLIKTLGRGNDRLGYPLAIGVYGFSAMCLFLFTFSVTRERVHSAADEPSTVRKDLRDLLRNRPWLVLGLVSVLCCLWISIRNASLVYYFKYFIGREDMTASFLVSGTIFTLLGVTLTTRLTRWFGSKKRAYIWMNVINAASLLPMFFAGPRDYVLIYSMQAVGSFVTGPLFPMIWAMYADTADFAEWKFGRRTTGLIFSAGTFSQKMGWTVGAAVAGWLLALYGFEANIVQHADTLVGIRLMVSLLPAAASLLTVAAALLYNLDAPLQQRIEADLASRRAAIARAAVPNLP